LHEIYHSIHLNPLPENENKQVEYLDRRDNKSGAVLVLSKG